MAAIIERAPQLRDKCGLFAVYDHSQASSLALDGLSALQHRGEGSFAIASLNAEDLKILPEQGLVSWVPAERLTGFQGRQAIACNRATYPIAAGFLLSGIEDGRISVDKRTSLVLASSRVAEGIRASSMIFQRLNEGMPLENAVRLLYESYKGELSLIAMTAGKMVVVRDVEGRDPLSLGGIGRGWAFASESCALERVKATRVREMYPGEMVVSSYQGLESIKLDNVPSRVDPNEYLHWANPTSILGGKKVHEVRRNLGRVLAEECPVEADVVVPVPDAAMPISLGFARALGLSVAVGLVRNRYHHASPVRMAGLSREEHLDRIFNAVPGVMAGKRVVLVDDVVVSGDTIRQAVRKVNEAGAKEVHVRVVANYTNYPLATPKEDGIYNDFRVNSFGYLPPERLREVIDG